MTPLSPQSLRPPCPSPSASLALFLGDAGGEGQGGTCSEPDAELSPPDPSPLDHELERVQVHVALDS